MYDDEVGVGEVQTVSSKPRLSARLDGLKPAEALQSKRVAIIGVGSGGSATAVNLAAAGAGTLHLFDKDFLSEENVFRHACDLRHLGRAPRYWQSEIKLPVITCLRKSSFTSKM